MIIQSFHNLNFRLAGAGIGLFLYSFISKNYPPEIFAELVIIQAASLLITTFCHFGQPISLLKTISANLTFKKIDLRNQILLSSFLICATFILLISIPVFIFKDFFSSLLNIKLEYIFILFLIVFFKVLQILIQEFFRAINKFRIFNIMQVLPQILFLFLLVINKTVYENIYNLINIYLLSLALLVIFCSLFLFLNGFRISFPNTKLEHIYKLLPLGYAFFTTSVVTIFSMEYSIIYLSKKIDPLTLACYAIALKLMMFLSMGVKALNSVTKPEISNLYSSNEIIKLKKLSKNFIFFAVAFYAISLFIFYLFGGQFIELLFDYDPDIITNLFFLLSITVFVNALTGPIGSIMEMCDLHYIYRNISVAGSIIFLTLAIILINKIGVTGLIISLILYELLINCSSWAYIIIKKKVFW